MHACALSGSVMSNSLQLLGLWLTRLLCPWDSPGKNTGMGCYTLLQGIFLIQGSNHVSCISGRFLTCWATREEYIYIYICKFGYVQISKYIYLYIYKRNIYIYMYTL